MDAPQLAGFERRPDRLGSMFSAISWRYDFLNTLLSLGQDGGWRAHLAKDIAKGARVLDLCCGSARSSVPAAKASGRRVTVLDVSFAMLEHGRTYARAQGAGFDPVHGDGFHLPFRDGTFDVVTAAFGLRNLVPLPEAAHEIQRVLVPGGRFLALDSVAPAGGAFAPFHAHYLRHVVPLLGRLSPDPGAYRYLSESIFDFGPPDVVARRLEAAGFETPVKAQQFLLGAVAIFDARRRNALSPHEGVPRNIVQSGEAPGRMCTMQWLRSSRGHQGRVVTLSSGPGMAPPRRHAPRDPADRAMGPEDRLALWSLLLLHLALEAVLVLAAWTLYKYMADIRLEPWQKVMFQVGLAAAFVAFGLRGLALWRRLRRGGPATRRP